MTYCFNCKRNVSGSEKDKCKAKNHDLDYDNLWDHKAKKSNKDTIEKTDPVDLLLNILKEKIKKIIVSENDSSRIFAIVSIHDHNETLELGTSHALSWIKATSYDKYKKLFSDETYTRTIDLVKAKAMHNAKIPVEPSYKRIAIANDEIYYDLGRKDWRMVKITKDEIRLVPYSEATPVFTRSKNQASHPEPKFNFTGNPVMEFCKLLRISNPTFPPHFISLFIENVPIPIIVILGQQGSIKSTQSGLIKRMVDPAGQKIEDNLSHLSRNIDDLNVHLSNNYLVAFDNISFISNEASDTLCKAITGAGYPKRKLYTDGDEVNLRYQRKIILNGISFLLDRGDLVERSIVYYTDKIPENERKTSQEVESIFKQILPDLLGQIFFILQKALVLYDKVKNEIQSLPRMADFAIWGESISRALGFKEGSFLQNYKKELDQSNEILNENNPLISFIEQEFSKNQEILYPLNAFYQNFKMFAANNQYDTIGSGFPKHANKMRGFITRSKPLLDELGIRIHLFKNTTQGNGFTKNQTIIQITKQSSPSSPSEVTHKQSNHSEDGDHTGKITDFNTESNSEQKV